MTVPFSGFVLRKPRLASSNSPFTAEGDVLVREQDRATYNTAVLSDPSAKTTEYLVRAAYTADLVTGSQAVTLSTTQTDDNGRVFQFEVGGREIEPISTTDVTPAADEVDTTARLVYYNEGNEPASAPAVAVVYRRLAVDWTKNDDTRRFGYVDSKQRWAPLPGNAPENLGAVQENGLLSLPVVESVPIGSAERSKLLLGTKDVGNAAPVEIPLTNQVDESTFQDYLDGTLTVSAGEGVLNKESGDVLLATDLVSNNLNQPVYFFRTNWFRFDETYGVIGAVGNALFLNPIPAATEHPLVRIGHRSFLRVDASTSSSIPSAGYQAVFNPDTGRLHLDPNLETQLDGKTVYYRGVLSNQTPIESYTHENLGTIQSDPFTTPGSPTVTSVELDSLILYVEETGEAIPNLDFVDSASDFKPPLNLPGDTAQIATDTGEIQLALPFMRDNEGQTLYAGTGDFPLENGITFRLGQSPVDPSNKRAMPDAKAVERVADEVLTDSVPAGSTMLINQPPLTDVAGYDENIFFKLQRGAVTRTLKPNRDLIYDFDNNQIQWASPETHNAVLTLPQYTLQLPHQVLHDAGATFELNEGQGYTELVEGEDALIEYGSGTVQFIEKVGETLFADVGTITAPDTIEATTVDFTGLSVPSDDLLKPILVVEDEAYRIESSTSSTITVDRDINATTANVEFEVLAAPEVVFKHVWTQPDLTERTVFPYVVTELDPVGNNFAPDGESFTFYADGAQENHVVLETETLGKLDPATTLTLTSYYQTVDANYQIFRDNEELTQVAGAPGPDEVRVEANYDLTFNATDEQNYEGADIILVPELSSGTDPRPIEVLARSREIGLPDSLQDPALALEVQTLVEESGYTVTASVLFFNRPFRAGQRLMVHYSDEDGNSYEEDVGFRIVETISWSQGQNVGSFGAGKEIDPNRSIQVRVNGHPVDQSVDPSGTVSLEGIRKGRKVQVTYYVREAQGSEAVVSLLNEPYVPPVEFITGSQQSFVGDHTPVVGADTVLLVNNQSFRVVGSSYNGANNTTEVELAPPVLSNIRDPDVLASNEPLGTSERDALPASLRLDTSSRGESQLRFYGDVRSSVASNHVLFVSGDPYYVEAVEFDEDAGFTRATLSTDLMREYDTLETYEQTTYPVYPPDPQVLLADRLGLPEEGFRLIRFNTSGGGTVLDPSIAYAFEGGGRIIVEPTVTDAPETGEIWQLAYTARRQVGPTNVAGKTFYPQFRASYTRRVNATQDNGFLGSTLKASYSFYTPDTFYFRAVDLAEYAGEVADEIDSRAKALTSSFGPSVSVAQSAKLYEKGNVGLIWEDGNLRDQDRAARQFLQFYNDVTTLFENVLEIVDGRVVGDRDGKFLFRLQDDEQPGGVDPISGELLPYYANPDNPGTKQTASEISNQTLAAQVGAIQNFIDDIVLVSKKPFSITGLSGVPPRPDIEMQGTFKPIWEPSQFSRFFPERSDVFTVTVPDTDANGDYEFHEDFTNTLADLKQDNLQAVNNIRKRAAKARVRKENGVTIEITGSDTARIFCGMEFNQETGEIHNTTYNIETGIGDQYVPPFAVGDHVNVGRVTYSKTGDVVTTTETIYGENMIVIGTGQGFVEVQLNPNAGQHADLTATDPTALSPEHGDTIFTIPKVMVDENNFSMASGDPPFYRTPLDVMVNQSDGELVNVTLPAIIADIMGQSSPEPQHFLDATLTFKSPLTEPFRFPALDGETVDDDGDNKPPYVSPFADSEIQRLNFEDAAHDTVQNETVEGIVLNGCNRINAYTIEVSEDLTLRAIPPELYDLLLIEGETASGVSVAFNVRSVDSSNVYVATFETEETGVAYEISSVVPSGSTGERDSVDQSQWNDPSIDFTRFSGFASLELVINGNTYSVVSLSNGELETATNISNNDAGPTTYELRATGTGDITADLVFVEDAAADFDDANGTLTLSASPSAGTYTIDESLNTTVQVYPENLPALDTIGILVGDTVATSANGAIDDPNSGILYTTDSVANIEAGQTLFVDSSSENGGRYIVAQTVTGSPNEIHIEPAPSYAKDSFYIIEGDTSTNNYPITWSVRSKPRRFSSEVQDLQDELVRQRVTYADNSDAPVDVQPFLTATSENPSTPYKERLLELIDLLFEPLLDITGDVTATGFTGANFEDQGIQEDDLVLVEQGPNRGFYPVTNVTTADITVATTNEFTNYSLTSETGRAFKIYRGTTFTQRTYQLVLFEYVNVLDAIDRLDDAIRMTEHDTDDFIGNGTATFFERPGDPDDPTLQRHQIAISDRFGWIRDDSPNLRQEIESILNGTEALYDIRYSWIDFRTNLEEGTLQRRKRFRANRDKRKRKLRKELLKLLSSQR